VPKEFIPAVRKGVDEALQEGVLAGYPVVDIKVTLTDGSYHDVDSNENAFKMAAIFAFKDGMRQAKPGAARADHGGRGRDGRGKDGRRDRRPVGAPRCHPGDGRSPRQQGDQAEVPLNEMFGYSTALRSLTQGRATYTMEFKHYAEAPKSVADTIINKDDKDKK